MESLNRNSTILTTQMILKAAISHDVHVYGISEDDYVMDDLIYDLGILRDYAMIHPKEYKELKTKFLHEDQQDAGVITDIFNKGYSRESHVFNTMLRCNNDLRISMGAIKKEKEDEIPPAFDESLMSDKLDVNYLLDLIRSRKIGTVNKIIDMINKEFKKIVPEDGFDMILTNGSSTGIQDEGIDIMDINAVCYKPPGWFLEQFSYLISELGINNFDKELFDCPLDESSTIAGEILHIPDKEFKIRSIYRMYWFIQLVSKRLHIKLDSVARKIEGNFTYFHKKWLYDIVRLGYNKDKYILTTDMSKYSDTLSANLIFGILEIAIDDKELVRQIHQLYTLPVLDTINGKIYKDPNGTYQGQYGDFPLITIVNCILQRIVYYLSGQKIRKGYLAAVGDDTGFIFDDYDDKLMGVVIDTYGKAGVQINTSKTHELIYGEGFGDFVKVEICGKGLINFFNISNAYKNNIDGFIREVYDSYLLNQNKDMMHDCLTQAFGPDIGDYLTNLSVINGGVSWHNITDDDLKLFSKRLMIIKSMGEGNTDKLRIWFDYFKETLIQEGLKITDTPLVGWIDTEGYMLWAKETGSINQNDYVEGRIFNTNLMGHDPRFARIDVRDLKTINMPLTKFKLDREWFIDDKTKDLLELINSYESREAVRRRKSKVKNISSYLTSFALVDSDGPITEFMPTGIYFKDYSAYTKGKELKRRMNNQANICYIPGVFMDGPYWGNYYLRWRIDGKIYNIDKVWNSKYPRPSKEFWCQRTGTDEEFYYDMLSGIPRG